MSDEARRVRWPDGLSLSIPLYPTPFGVKGTYYFNPGATTAPKATVAGDLALGTSGRGAHAVFLRDGMTSSDTLGWGMSGNVSSILPSVTLNSTMPDWHGLPLPWKAKVSSVEAGIGMPGASRATSYTWTPQQVADFVNGLTGPFSRITSSSLSQLNPVTAAMGPDDELSPFTRTLSSSNGSLGQAAAPAARYLGRRQQNQLGGGMGDWRSSTRASPPASGAPIPSQEAGGILGLLQDYLGDRDLAPR